MAYAITRLAFFYIETRTLANSCINDKFDGGHKNATLQQRVENLMSAARKQSSPVTVISEKSLHIAHPVKVSGYADYKKSIILCDKSFSDYDEDIQDFYLKKALYEIETSQELVKAFVSIITSLAMIALGMVVGMPMIAITVSSFAIGIFTEAILSHSYQGFTWKKILERTPISHVEKVQAQLESVKKNLQQNYKEKLFGGSFAKRIITYLGYTKNGECAFMTLFRMSLDRKINCCKMRLNQTDQHELLEIKT